MPQVFPASVMSRKTGQTLIAFVTYWDLLGQQYFCISQPTVAYPVLSWTHPTLPITFLNTNRRRPLYRGTAYCNERTSSDALKMPASLICGLHNGAEVQKESLISISKIWLAEGRKRPVGKKTKWCLQALDLLKRLRIDSTNLESCWLRRKEWPFTRARQPAV